MRARVGADEKGEHSPTMSDMKAFVGVTDKAWADILAQRPHLDEINF